MTNSDSLFLSYFTHAVEFINLLELDVTTTNKYFMGFISAARNRSKGKF